MEGKYSAHKNVQILLALLKEHGIKNIVCSAGTRNISFVFSALRDDFFKCYSVVDERSAGFFALGLIQATKEPAAIVCTSGTAACNYLSAVTEAYYQHLPLVVLTSDRLRYHLNQQEDQCIPQLHIYQDVIRKVVDLSPVRDEMDAWYCGRLVNEALLELDHREKGPVHINFQVDPSYPINDGDYLINQPELPKVTKISRIMADDDDANWLKLVKRMENKRILICYGQQLPLAKEETDIINCFCKRFDAVFYCEHISNLHVDNCIICAGILTPIQWEKICPDIVITVGGHRMADPKKGLRKCNDKFEHWHVSPNGEVSDLFMCQNMIIECKQRFFFQKTASLAQPCRHPYLEEWRALEVLRKDRIPHASFFDWSQVYAIRKLIDNLPTNALLHISNSNSIRIFNSFGIPDTVEVYCNRGTCGIDGTMSSYIANSFITDRPSFLCIGDLSFFYDMNALWNKYPTDNTRIMLCNNSGGAILNWGPYLKVNVENAEVNTGAVHHTSAKGWVESRGFKYLSAKNKTEFDAAIVEFVSPEIKQPILLEVFTDMPIDIRERERINDAYMSDHDVKLKKMKDLVPQPIKKAKQVINSILKK